MTDTAALREQAAHQTNTVLNSWLNSDIGNVREVAREELRTRERARSLMTSMTGVVTPPDDAA